jgi:hypothetical protein
LGNDEYCLELWTNGFWNDISCSIRMPYVCQKRAIHSFCAVPGPGLRVFLLVEIIYFQDRQLCGPQNIDEMECADGFGCCWDPEIDQCFRPESTFQCLEMGGSCKSKDNIDCNRGIGPGVDICPQVQSKIIKKLKSFRINDAAWTVTQINARRRKNSGKLMTENVF